MAQSQSAVMKLYHSVIDDVIAGVREAFLDEGVDEQVLQELKQIWETKLASSKAIEVAVPAETPEPQPPQLASQVNARNNVPKTAASNVAKKTEPTTSTSTTFASQPQAGQPQQLVQQAQQQQQPVQQQTTVLVTDPNKQVPIQITLPAQAGVPDSQPRVLTIQVPYSALQNNQLSTVLTGPVISATMALPQHLACSLLQQHVNSALQGQAAGQLSQAQASATNGTARPGLRQLDGTNDTSDEDEDDDDDDIDDDDENDDKDEEDNEDENDGGMEEEPLNSDDDVSNEDPGDLFDTDNVVVCQYDKITRSRNKWKFYLKDGIMNLNGKDFVFQKSNGDAEW